MPHSIDSLYTHAVEQLTEQGAIVEVSRKLMSLKTNSERAHYVFKILNELHVLPDIKTIYKSARLSDKYRELGNQCFQKCRDYEALQFYNMSLLYAPLESSQISLAYSNRSAVLYSIKRYDECLKDIDTVFSMNYPEKLRPKLLKRQSLCREGKLERPVDEYEKRMQFILTPMQGRNSRYICASSKVDVRYSKEQGRHVVATEDIDPGEILAVEEPYARYLLQPQALFSCNRCFSFTGNLIPCDNCCITLFCSQECKEKAHEEYHSIECSIGPTLVAMRFTKLELLALRIVIKARCERPIWQSLIDLVLQADDKSESDQCGFVNIGDTHVYDSKYYDSIHSLATNEELRTASDIFQKAVTAAVFLHLLLSTSFFDGGTEGALSCAGGLLMRHVMTSPTNMHTVNATVYESDGTCVSGLDVGSAAYGFLSLLNHSCAPNVVRFTRPGTATIILVSLRSIKKGMQLFDNYGFHHAVQTKEERHKNIKFQYKFDCECEACKDDWPLYFDSLFTTNLPKDIRNVKENLLDPDTIESLKAGCVKTALEKFKPLCSLAKSLERFVPCAEIGETQEAIKQCMFIIQGMLPHGYTKNINWVDIVMKE